jgi:hypothetical protein
MTTKTSQSKHTQKGFSGKQTILIGASCSVALYLMLRPVVTRWKEKGDLLVASNIKAYELLLRIFS